MVLPYHWDHHRLLLCGIFLFIYFSGSSWSGISSWRRGPGSRLACLLNGWCRADTVCMAERTLWAGEQMWKERWCWARLVLWPHRTNQMECGETGGTRSSRRPQDRGTSPGQWRMALTAIASEVRRKPRHELSIRSSCCHRKPLKGIFFLGSSWRVEKQDRIQRKVRPFQRTVLRIGLVMAEWASMVTNLTSNTEF